MEGRPCPLAIGSISRWVVMKQVSGGDEGGVVVSAEPGTSLEVVEADAGCSR